MTAVYPQVVLLRADLDEGIRGLELPDAVTAVEFRIIVPDDGTARVVDAAEPIRTSLRGARPADGKAAALHLAQQFRATGGHARLLIALDEVSAASAWYAAQHVDKLLAVNGIEPALRILALLRAGRSLESILSAPTVTPTRVLAEGGIAPWGHVDVEVPCAIEGSPGADLEDPWLSLRASELQVRRDALPRAERDPLGLQEGSRAVPVRAENRLLIGPANYAGQGRAWAQAVNRFVADFDAQNVYIYPRDARILFDGDVPLSNYEWHSPWQRFTIARDLVMPASHVMLEAARPILGVDRTAGHAWSTDSAEADLNEIHRAGKAVALLFHGSEIRDPARHASLDPWSPFRDPVNSDFTRLLAARVADARGLLRRRLGPSFVSTLDLLDHVPDAVWLPVVVGESSFTEGPRALEGRVPVVAHAPTSSVLKGSRWVDPVLEALDHEGLIVYRRFRNLPSHAVPAALRKVDILVDQVVLGGCGVLAAQALAAGRLVLAHLSESVRRRFPIPPPIIEVNPSTLEEVVREIVASRAVYADVAMGSRAFARAFHDGRFAADVLQKHFLKPATGSLGALAEEVPSHVARGTG